MSIMSFLIKMFRVGLGAVNEGLKHDVRRDRREEGGRGLS